MTQELASLIDLGVAPPWPTLRPGHPVSDVQWDPALDGATRHSPA
jgi:hypothetical protein